MRNWKKITKWTIGISCFVILALPIFLWTITNSCTGKIGTLDGSIVASYQALSDSSKRIEIKRFMATEYFKYPFVNYKTFEFYLIVGEGTENVQATKINGEIFYDDPSVLRKTFNTIPNRIYLDFEGKPSWKEYYLNYENITLKENPEASVISMLQYGPTLAHLFGICD